MASPWYASKAVLAAAILGVLLLVALLVVPYFLDIERYRALLVERLEQTTGREAEVESLRLHFLPSLRVVAGNLGIKNPTGFPADTTVAVEQIQVGLALWPLLRGQVEVTSVSVERVQVNLLENERGQTNYRSLLRKVLGREGKEGNGASPVSLSRVSGLTLEAVSLSFGRFWRRDKRVHLDWTLKGINLVAGGLDFGDPEWLSNLNAEVDLNAVEVASPALKQPLRFDKGTVAIEARSARGNFAFRLGSLRAQGTMKVADLAHPVADFTLRLNELNVFQLGALLGGAPLGGPTPRGRLLARGTVQGERLLAPPLRAERLQAKASLYRNRFEVDPFTFTLHGGVAQGSLGVDLSGNSKLARVRARIEGVNLGQLMAATNPDREKKLTGTLDANARLGIPLGAPDPVAALSGEGTFSVREGTFPGLDFQSALAQMAKWLGIGVPVGDTRFRYFGGDFRIENQRVHSQQLRLEAEALEATLQGSFGFDQSLNYTGTGVLQSQVPAQQQESSGDPLKGLRRLLGKVMQQNMNISGMRVPFVVSGTLQQPKILPRGAPELIPQSQQ